MSAATTLTREPRYHAVAESQETNALDCISSNMDAMSPRQALRRALEWAKIAANNLNSGGKVLHAHGWEPEVNPFTGAAKDVLMLIEELEGQLRRFDQ